MFAVDTELPVANSTRGRENKFLGWRPGAVMPALDAELSVADPAGGGKGEFLGWRTGSVMFAFNAELPVADPARAQVAAVTSVTA